MSTQSLATSSALALCIMAAPVQAQEAAGSASPQTGGVGEAGIGEIVVTAQRREENVQKVPIAVTAVTGDTLLSRGITDISMLGKFVPGFSFGRTGSDARPAMRGIRTANNEVNGDPVIGYYIDGVYQSRTSQAILGFVDVARVEVQRGPQGTLYGRNTIGGNITVTTNEPVNEIDYGATVSVGNYRRGRIEGFVNVPLSDAVSFRVAAAAEDQNGWVKNDFNSAADLFDINQRFIRGSLKFEKDAFKAVLRADYSHNGGNGDSAFGYKQIGTYYDLATCQPFFNASLLLINSRGNNRDAVNDCTTTAATPTVAAGVGVDLGIPIFKAGKKYRIDNDYRTYRDLSQFGSSLDMSYDFGPLTLRSISGYVDYEGNRTSDSDFSSSRIAVDLQNTTTKTYSQELQILSNPGSNFDYVAGLFYYRDRLGSLFINQQFPAIVRSTATTTPVLRAQANGVYNYNRTKLNSKAAYAQVTFHATDQLSLTGGLRYTSDRKQFFNSSANGILPLPVAGQPNPLTLITIDTPLVPDSVFGARPSNCGGAVTATVNIDSAGRYVGANYCPRTFNEITYRVGVDYEVSPRNLLYASLSSGFRSGGFNAGQLQAASAPTFEPETVTAYELGSKNRFFDNTVQFNVSAFYNRYSSLQEPRPIIIGSTVISTIFNAATARSYGAEFEAVWEPTDALTIGGNLSVLNAKYSKFVNVPLPYGTSILVNDPSAASATVVNGVTIAPVGQRRLFAPGYSCTPIAGTGTGVAGQPALSFGCDLSGNNIPHSPRYSGSVYASYIIDLGSGGTLTPFAAVAFSGAYDEQSFNDRVGRSPKYAKLDLTLTWKPNDQYQFELFGTNVTNETVRTIVSFGGTPLQASYEPPRMYGIRLTVRR